MADDENAMEREHDPCSRPSTDGESEEESAPETESAHSEAIVEDDFEDLADEIDATKDAFASEAVDIFFHVRPLLGKWTKEHKGVLCDALGAFARKGPATDWCKRYKFPRQCALYFSKYDGDACKMLCAEYCRRGHFFFNQFLEGCDGDGNFDYTPGHLDSYEETEEWLDFACSIDIAPDEFAKATEIRHMLPSNPH